MGTDTHVRQRADKKENLVKNLLAFVTSPSLPQELHSTVLPSSMNPDQSQHASTSHIFAEFHAYSRRTGQY